MDRSSGKRRAGGLVTRTKACISGLRSATSEEDENAKFCNRIGCRGRIKYSHNTKTGSSDKAEGSSPSHSSNEKKLIRKSSLCRSMITCARKSYLDSKRKVSSQLNLEPSERSPSSETEAPELTSLPTGQTGDQLEPSKESGEVTVRETRKPMTSLDAHISSPSSRTRDQSESTEKSGEITLRETRRPRISLKAIMRPPCSRTRDKSESIKRDGDVTVTRAGQPRVSSSARMSPPSSRTRDHSESEEVSKDAAVTETVRPRASSNDRPTTFHDKTKLHHQNNLSSASILLVSESSTTDGASAVVPPRSSLESLPARGKRSSGGENSPSHRAIKTTTASTIDRQKSPSTRGISISDSRHGSGAASVLTRGSTNLDIRVRRSPRQTGRTLSFGQPNFRTLQSPERISSRDSILSSPSSSIGDSGHGFTHLTNRELLHQHNMDRIAEGSLAFRRFAQNEDLTYEALLALQGQDRDMRLNDNLSYQERLALYFSTPDDQHRNSDPMSYQEMLALYYSNLDDQHRDMRLNIDNMSYEELLALEERIGTVSTALSKEALSNCLRRSIYQPDPSIGQIKGTDEDEKDVKCSICQEEYVIGDEVGKLVDCQHGFHVICINEWLQLKNWCPMCKASAGPSQSSLSM